MTSPRPAASAETTPNEPVFNNRRHERFRLEPMYTCVMVERKDRAGASSLEGHAYDISEAGVRIELDEALDDDECVTLSLGLPRESDRINAAGRVVWVNDCNDDPAARRMALEFIEFITNEDRDRLKRHLGSGAAMRLV